MKTRKGIGPLTALIVSLGLSIVPTDAKALISYFSTAIKPGLVILTATTYNTSGLDYLIWDFMGTKAQFSYPGGFQQTEWTTHALTKGETGSLSWIFTSTPVRGRYHVRGEHQWVAVATGNITYKVSGDDIYVDLNTP